MGLIELFKGSLVVGAAARDRVRQDLGQAQEHERVPQCVLPSHLHWQSHSFKSAGTSTYTCPPVASFFWAY
jgi:hypothetical protein